MHTICFFMSLSLSSSEISAKRSIFFWSTIAPLSDSDWLLQCKAIHTEMIGTNWSFTKAVKGWPDNCNYIDVSNEENAKIYKEQTSTKSFKLHNCLCLFPKKTLVLNKHPFIDLNHLKRTLSFNLPVWGRLVVLPLPPNLSLHRLHAVVKLAQATGNNIAWNDLVQHLIQKVGAPTKNNYQKIRWYIVIYNILNKK